MKIRYFAWLKNITNIENEVISNKKIKDINALKKYLCQRYPKLDNYILKEQVVRIAVNLEYTYKNIKLSDKDEIAIFPPVSGG